MDDDTRVALEAFCRAEHGPLLRVLELSCGDRTAAEDLAQETLARVWLRWETVGRLDRPDLWARRVGLNLAASWWRRRRTAIRAYPSPPVAPPAEPCVSLNVHQLLGALPARQRTAVVLRFYEDRSIAEVAMILRCREGTVRSLTAQAVATLRALGVEQADDDDA